MVHTKVLAANLCNWIWQQPLCIIFFVQTDTCEMYTEDAVTHNTVLKEMDDKSQLQTEPCAERQVQTNQICREPHTTGEGQLLWKLIRDKPDLLTL